MNRKCYTFYLRSGQAFTFSALELILEPQPDGKVRIEMIDAEGEIPVYMPANVLEAVTEHNDV